MAFLGSAGIALKLGFWGRNWQDVFCLSGTVSSHTRTPGERPPQRKPRGSMIPDSYNIAYTFIKLKILAYYPSPLSSHLPHPIPSLPLPIPIPLPTHITRLSLLNHSDSAFGIDLFYCTGARLAHSWHPAVRSRQAPLWHSG